MQPNLAFHLEVLSKSLEFFKDWDAQSRNGQNTAFHLSEAACVIADAKEALAYLHLSLSDARIKSDQVGIIYKKAGNG